MFGVPVYRVTIWWVG